MAVEVHEDGGMTITGEHIATYRHVAIATMLALEINTGMKATRLGSPMMTAKGLCGSVKRTKRAVLGDYVKWLQATYPQYSPAPSVVKALDGK